MISPQDEHCHPPEKGMFWNESYYFNFFDAGAGLGGFTRIGMSPNLPRSQDRGAPKGLGDQMLGLYLPDGRIGMVRDVTPIDGNPEAVQVGGLRYECTEPFKSWRLVYNGPIHIIENPGDLRDPLTLPLRPFEHVPVELDFSFSHANDVVDYHNDALKRGFMNDPIKPFSRLSGKNLAAETIKCFQRIGGAARMQGANHFEQTGRYEGTLKLGQETIEFQGTGQRDRSWGIRDWRVPSTWCWLTGQFGQGKDFVCFNACQVEFMLFKAAGGFVHEAGVNHIIKDIRARVEFQPDGVTQKALTLRLAYGQGRVLEVTGDVKVVAPIAMAQGLYRIVVNEAMTEYTCRAGKCLGMSEFLFQL